MFARDLNASGCGPGTAAAIVGSMSQTFTAAGTTQATATAISSVNTFVTAGSEGNGVILPDFRDTSDAALVCNSLAVSVYVYPPVGDKINGQATNAPFMLAAGRAAEFTYVGDGINWMAR